MAKDELAVEVRRLLGALGQADTVAGWIVLVQVLDALVEIVLDGGQGGHDGRGPEAVGDEGKVGEVLLDGGVEDGLGPGVAQRGPVLVQKVHQLLADNPAKQRR